MVTTSNYSAIANSHTEQFTTAHTKFPQFVFTSRFLVTDPKSVLCLHPYWLANVSQLNNLSLMSRSTVSWPVCLGIKHPCGAYVQTFVRQLQACECGTLSLTRGRVWPLQLLVVLASAVIFVSESRGPRGHVLLSLIRDFPFRRLLRLAGLTSKRVTLITPWHGQHRKHSLFVAVQLFP
jgi:hypothetical protein